MKEDIVLKYSRGPNTIITWKMTLMAGLTQSPSNRLDTFRYKAWQSLNHKEKDSIIHTWENADVQRMENEEGPVDTVAVMFETKNNERDGFIIVYIDIRSKKVTGSESFY